MLKIIAIWTGLVLLGVVALTVYGMTDPGTATVNLDYVVEVAGLLLFFGFFVWITGLIVVGLGMLQNWTPNWSRRAGPRTVCSNCGSDRWLWNESTGYECRKCGVPYTAPAAADSQGKPTA